MCLLVRTCRRALVFTITSPPQSLGRGETIDREVAGRGPRGYSRFTHAVVTPCAGLGS